MRPVLRLFLRRERQAARQAKDLVKMELIDQALADDDILGILESAIQAEYDFEHANTKAAGGFGEFIQSIFKFIVDHQAEILGLLQLIMQLLAVMEKPPATK